MLSTTSKLLEEANDFITQMYTEIDQSNDIEKRLKEIEKEIYETGTYTHSFDELVYGARVAWRNSNRCIGRLFWDKMHILDARAANTNEEVHEALLHHIQYASNKGRIKPTITIFKQYKNENNQIKIFNHQLIRYAGYESANGKIGDPHSISFTNFCKSLGWGENETAFDVLPLVFSIDGKNPVYYTIPSNDIVEVPISHPTLPFESLNMRWYGVPIISEMVLEMGGIRYTAAPFNGWYMGTEIGARNLADEERYNMLPKVAEIMNLDTTTNLSLWKDRALVELNAAVLHSYKKNNVSIVDHHTAAQQFKEFEKKEVACGRLVTGRWSWLIPPLSPATTHVFHKGYQDTVLKPNFFKRQQ